ncbi:MAG: NIPSNAP family protein [Pirellulales bacterium]
MLRTAVLRLIASLTMAASTVIGSFTGSFTGSVALSDDGEPKSATRPAAQVYELAVVRANPGRLDALEKLVRDHELSLLPHRGMQPVAFLTAAGERPHEALWCLYAVANPADGAAKDGNTRWRQVHDDPAWKQAEAAADADGKVIESVTVMPLRMTSWSPSLSIERSEKPRVFELRTYTCPDADKLTRLQKRFADHTMGLFAKHGMQNIVYWLPYEAADSERMLVYLLAHDSIEAAGRSFDGFRQDPAWVAAKNASEQEAGGSLTVKQNGVVSQFLKPTAFSPLR